jgi:LacI family transcriptional regulator
VSLRDVARLAGVSPSTASRVVSGSDHPVSAESRARVLEAAQRLSFHPNRVARALATARTQTIGVIVHDTADPYFAQIIRGLEDVVGEHDHALFVASSDRDPETELACIRAFQSHQVDAIVLAASGIDQPEHITDVARLLDLFINRGGSVVSLSENPYPSPGIRIDNHGVTAMATQHLIDLGHQRISFLAGPHELFVSKVRLDGYRSALSWAGIPFDPNLIFDGYFTLQGGREASRQVVAVGDVTGIVAANDLAAVGALRGLAEQGVGVPDDISVIGINDITLTEYAPVPLTTVHVDLTELGRKGAHLVMTLLSGGKPESALMPHWLIPRQSTSPPPGSAAPPLTGPWAVG